MAGRRRVMLWTVVTGWGLVIGGVMGFGLIGALTGTFDRESAVWMLGMIVPMSIVAGLVVQGLVRRTERKVEPLLQGIHEVAEGDLSVQLVEKGAAEYSDVYEEFNAMTRELRATREEMESFVNEFSHEFKTPITSIAGFADLLVEMGDDLSADERAEYLRIISDQAHRLSRLSQNTLLLSKVEAMQVVADREEYSLSGQVQDCAMLFLDRAEERNIELGLECDERISYTANPELLEHVWINLIDNALKYTPDGGAVTVGAATTDGAVRVWVRDTGRGMTEDECAHVFQKYYQAGKAAGSSGGNGIGLAIVRRVVELCGGSVSVASTPGQGSTFTVELPL